MRIVLVTLTGLIFSLFCISSSIAGEGKWHSEAVYMYHSNDGGEGHSVGTGKSGHEATWEYKDGKSVTTVNECYDAWYALKEESLAEGFCIIHKENGDKIFAKYHNKSGKGAYKIVGGTGKSKGITGSGTLECEWTNKYHTVSKCHGTFKHHIE